jgi:hypothetical protein
MHFFAASFIGSAQTRQGFVSAGAIAASSAIRPPFLTILKELGKDVQFRFS